jgi:hypothetical protein
MRVAKITEDIPIKKPHSRNDPTSAKVEKGTEKHIQACKSRHHLAPGNYGIP